MGKPRLNKYRPRKRTKQAKVNRKLALRRCGSVKTISKEDRCLNESVTISTNDQLKKDGTLDSMLNLPVISAVHGNDYFEKHPFSMQHFAEKEIQIETEDSIIIKTEPCEDETILFDEMNKPVMKTIPETQQQHHLKDHNILSSQINSPDNNFNQAKAQNMTFDKENKLLIDVIRYLDECAKTDKFDLAGKLYAAKLRSVMFTNQQAIAENLCRQVLLEAEHFNLDEKIVLSKEHPSDYISNRKNRIDEVKKSNFELSFNQLDKTALFQNIQNRLTENNREDRFDKFGKLYATKMRSFSEIQYFYADKLINEIILEAELCRLRANFKLSKLGDPPSHIFTTGKSYARIYRTKVPVVPSSDITCDSNQVPPRQTDQLSIETSEKQFICSLKRPSITYSRTPDLSSIKNSEQQFPTSKSSSSVSNSVLKPRNPKNIRRKDSKIQSIDDSGDKESMNISFTLPMDSLTLTGNVISAQNNVHDCVESLPFTLPDILLNTPNPKKTRQSIR